MEYEAWNETTGLRIKASEMWAHSVHPSPPCIFFFRGGADDVLLDYNLIQRRGGGGVKRGAGFKKGCGWKRISHVGSRLRSPCGLLQVIHSTTCNMQCHSSILTNKLIIDASKNKKELKTIHFTTHTSKKQPVC